jgi:hypothetical protein
MNMLLVACWPCNVAANFCISGRPTVTPARSSLGEPNEFVREIDTRMPVILPEEHQDAGKEVLVPCPADRMKAWRVRACVNSPKNDDRARFGL